MSDSRSAQHDLEKWLYLLENRHYDEIQLGLDRIKTVALRLGVLDLNSVVITVGGTNGKGSTVSALESIYCEAGYRVGAYTSPHLLYFNERIRLNQTPISNETLCTLFDIIENALEDTHLTYFETATLAALLYFKQHAVDVLLLEVGMGGRLDATNCIDAALSIITTIDFDHEAYLGNTREAIGFEKSGILRPNQWFIYADYNPPITVIDKAASLNANRFFLGQDYSFYVEKNALRIDLHQDNQTFCLPVSQLHVHAIAAAVMACHVLRARLPVTQQQLIRAVQSVSLPGRRQVSHTETFITVLDVAHNPQAVRLLASCIENLSYQGRVHAVFSALKDKDLCGLIEPMLKFVDVWHVAPLPTQRAASSMELAAAFKQVANMEINCYSSIEMAYKMALKEVNQGDLMVVYGSFLTVSAVMLASTQQENVL